MNINSKWTASLDHFAKTNDALLSTAHLNHAETEAIAQHLAVPSFTALLNANSALALTSTVSTSTKKVNVQSHLEETSGHQMEGMSAKESLWMMRAKKSSSFLGLEARWKPRRLKLHRNLRTTLWLDGVM